MKKRKFVIGLTGNIGAGKSTVGEILKKNGFTVIDADRIGWQILERLEIKKEMLNEFGDVLKNGTIDRKKLGQIVFSDKRKLKLLNALIHPLLLQKLKREIQKNNKEIIVVNAALIFEWEIENWFDKIVLVTASKEKRLQRLLKKNYSKEDAIQRINAQMNDKKMIKKSDFVIINNGTKNKLKSQTLALVTKLCPNYIK